MKYLFRLFLILLLPVGAASAEDAAKELEEINVTATRTERAAKETPAAIDTVSKEDMQNTRMFNLKEALSGLSGVQSESKNGGYDSRLIIRGAGLKARYGVREIMVLLDGVPITDPDGMSRLDFVDSQLVERIDVVKGPNSTLYGANAAGGVINIITRNPFEERKSVAAGFGSNNTQMYNLNYGTRINNTYVNLSGSRRSTDSWRAWNEFSTNQANLKVGHLFADNSTVEASLGYSEANLQLPGTLTKAQFDQDIRQLTSDVWRNMGRFSRIWTANIKMEKEVGNFTFKPLVYFQSWNHFHPVTGIINDGGADIYGIDLQVDMKHRIAGMEGTLTSGVTAQLDNGDGDKFTYRDFVLVPGPSGRIKNTLSDEKGSLAETDDDTTKKWGVFMQESLRPSKKWIIDLGVRFDQVTFDIDNKVFREFDFSAGKYVNPLPSEANVRMNRTFDAVSPRIGVVYTVNEIVNLYGNLSTGFQTPQSSEMSVNPRLTPMKVYNYETGLKARFKGGHSIDLSAFYMNVKDEIVQTLDNGSSSYSNAGKSEKKGIELNGKYQIVKGLFAGGSYTYSDFRFKEFTEIIGKAGFDRSGNAFPYIPKHQYSAYLYFKDPSGLRFRLDTNTWGQYFVDNANSERFEGYKFVTNALVAFEKKNLDVTLNVLNIFDKRYAMEVTKDNNVLKFRPGDPLTLTARATWKF